VTDESQTTPHEHFEVELPELALGVLDGRERSVLLAHVEACPSCTAELERLIAAADMLVGVAGELDPPVGFETRVFDRIQAHHPVTKANTAWRRRFLLVATTAAVLAAAFSIGWVVHSPKAPMNASAGTPRTYDHFADAPLVSRGKTVGDISLYTGTPSWMFMSVGSSKWSGTVWCAVTSTDGRTRTVGSFDLVSGRGAWGAPLPVAADKVRTAELESATGRVLARAQLSTNS
jgi:hypothetical protein